MTLIKLIDRASNSNWSYYNVALRSRGDITAWLSEDAIAQWYAEEGSNVMNLPPY